MMNRNFVVHNAARRPGVLVVDGEVVVRKVLDLGLWREGFAVWLAGDGYEALELYRRRAGEIDLVLLEVRLPGSGGPQTLAALRRLNPEVRCCLMNGTLGDYTDEELLELGAAAYLNKPFSFMEVALVLRRMLGIPHRGPHRSTRFPSILSQRWLGAG
jgi:CheY-like chemotaxis protein